jgi:hypothetical protein
VTAVTRLARHSLVLWSTALLATSLVLLMTGHFLSWYDRDGFQSDEWNHGYGDLAGVVAFIAVMLAFFDRTARQAAGAVVGGFAAFLVIFGLAAPYPTFVGSTGLSGILAWAIPLAMAAFVLLTPRWARRGEPWERRPGRTRLTAWARWAIYTLLALPAGFLCLVVATTLTTMGHPECGGPGDACTEEYAGWFLGLLVWILLVLGLVVAEAVTAVLCRVRAHRRARGWAHRPAQSQR